MKKVLFTATVDSHILQFHLPYLKLFKEKGYEVHVATNGDAEIPYCDVKHKVCFEKSPLKINNLRAIKQLKKIINEEKFDIIHCHTPMGSVVTRLAARSARKNGTRVIYTAHGFHFFKGAPAHYWMMFYPIEKYLSKFTDTLILINKEDYELAKRKFKKCKDIQYVPGVGIDEKKFDFEMSEDERTELRASLGLKKDDFVMIFPAELNKNKNQIMLINAMEELVKKHENIHLLLPGTDLYDGYYQTITKDKNLDKNVHFLGYRKDIPRLLKISDLAVSSSKREGLPVNILEAMCAGLPVVATDCRGQRDLIADGENGYLIQQNDSRQFVECVEKIYDGSKFIVEIDKQCVNKYLLNSVVDDLSRIYESQSKKRILHVLASNSFSGAENVVCTIIENMKDKFDMAYCSPKGKIESVLKQRDIKYYGLKKLSYFQLRKVIKEYKPDCIHAHDYSASFLCAFFSSKSIKCISHLHNNWPFATRWNYKTILYRMVLNKFSRIVGVSEKIYEEAVYRDKMQDEYVTIYNYVDASKILKLASRHQDGNIYDLFYIGRLTEQKNPLFYIEIVSEIAKEYPNIKAVMIGDGELYSQCLEKIREGNLEKNIKLIGFIDNPYEIIDNSRIGIMPSKWEGFGLTAIESLILGKPVLNSGAGGLGEIFHNDEFYICRDKEEYIKKVEMLMKDGKEYNFKNITSKYSNIEEWKSKMENLYI